MTNKSKKHVIKKDFLHIRSFSYFIRKALATVEGMPLELWERLGEVIGDCDLTTFKDLATLEKALKKISFN